MLYGGEDNESIRFMMEDEPPLEEPPLERPPLSEEAEQWVAQVENEKRQIEALDNVVRRVYFIYGDKANENKAWAELCGCAGRWATLRSTAGPRPDKRVTPSGPADRAWSGVGPRDGHYVRCVDLQHR